MPYSRLPSVVLNNAMERGILISDNKELLNDYFFEYGPGPTGLLDLIRHLKENSKRTKMICAQFIDVASNTWAYSREITGRSTLLTTSNELLKRLTWWCFKTA
jgi:hypothetical protein